jgi:hypothetical protein
MSRIASSSPLYTGTLSVFVLRSVLCSSLLFSVWVSPVWAAAAGGLAVTETQAVVEAAPVVSATVSATER